MMTDTNDIIDAPIDQENIKKEPFAIGNKWDFRVNVILIALTASPAFFAILFQQEILFLSIIGYIITGIYQPISALIGALRGNKAKLSYLVITIIYVVFLVLGLEPLSKSVEIDGLSRDMFLVVFVFVIPAFMAIYYTRLSYLSRSK